MPTRKWMIVTGWILTIIPLAVLVPKAIVNIVKPPEIVEGRNHL